MKDLSIGGIVMLNRTDKGDKEEEIVEPMEVKFTSKCFRKLFSYFYSSR